MARPPGKKGVGKLSSAKGRKKPVQSLRTTILSDPKLPKPKKKKKKAAGKGGRGWGWLVFLLKWSSVAAIWIVVALGALTAWYAYDLPSVGGIAQMTRQPNVTILAQDGTPVASFGGVFGQTVRLDDLPPVLPQAVVAVEDRRFYNHIGMDWRGIARAMVQNLLSGRVVQGGSTLTQQLAKNLFLTPDRKLKRKIQELMLALWLEHKFSKDQILTIYLNRVYFGGGAYGVDAAARHYFDKPATEVTLYEAALLAGLLKAPSRLNPVLNPDDSEDRAALVLNAMRQVNFITEAEEAQAKTVKTIYRASSGNQGQYFADWIMAQVRDYLGAIDQDLQVTTSLDAKMQRIAELELKDLLEREGTAQAASQAALLSMAPDGAVRAMVGGRDYGVSQFNRATQALRQPGSSFKVFAYLAGLEQAGLRPDSKIMDAPVTYGNWSPKNYGGKYYGEVSLREAFARSLNSVAVRITQQTGPQTVADTAERLGITSKLDPTGGIALGASEVTLLELTGAYAAFANTGEGVWPYGILEIRTAQNQILYRRQESQADGPGRVVAPSEVARMTDLMHAAVEWGTGKAANPGRPAAGKTGTSQDFRDAWFVGFTAELVTGVWLGNDDNSPMKKVTGGGLPARLWGRYMSRALQGQPPRNLPALEMQIVTTESLASPMPQKKESSGGLIDRILTGLSQEKPEDKDRDARLDRLFQKRAEQMNERR